MSCWVVPTIAAELWGVPLEQVLGQIRAGAVVSKLDYGFMLVDVAPDSRTLAPAPVCHRFAPPMTYIPADGVEQEANSFTPLPAVIDAESTTTLTPDLACEPLSLAIHGVSTIDLTTAVEPIATVEPAQAAQATDETPTDKSSRVEQANTDDESEDGPDPNFGEPDDGKPLNWRAARTRASALRRRPPVRFS